MIAPLLPEGPIVDSTVGGLIVILLLIAALVTKELVGFFRDDRAARLNRSQDVVVLPLVVGVATVIISRVL